MSDPLDYMNALCKWPEPPPQDDRWIKKLAAACEMIAERDADVQRWKFVCEQLAQAMDPRMDGTFVWRVRSPRGRAATFEQVIDQMMQEETNEQPTTELR